MTTASDSTEPARPDGLPFETAPTSSGASSPASFSPSVLDRAASQASVKGLDPQGGLAAHASLDGSLKDSDSPALCFNSGDDAINHARHLVEHFNGWLSSHNINLADGYERLDFYIKVRLWIASDPGAYQLIFSAVPLHWKTYGGLTEPIGQDHEGAGSGGSDLNFFCPGCHSYRDNDLMFLGVTKLVQCPEKIIPSFVWLERGHQVEDSLWDFMGSRFAASMSANLPVHIQRIRGEWKVGVLSAIAGRYGTGESTLVKGGPEIVNCVEGDAAQSERQWPCELHLKDLIESVSATLDTSFVWVSFVEGGGLKFKLRDALLCVREGIS